MERWERFFLASQHVGYQHLQVREISDGPRRTASLTVFKFGEGANISGFFFDASPSDPLDWIAFGNFSEEGTTTYVRESGRVVCAGDVVSEIPEDAFPGQMSLPLCQSIELVVGAARKYSLLGDGDGRIEGRATLEIVSLEAPLPDGSEGGFVHFTEQVEGNPGREFYIDGDGSLACSVWGPGCWSVPVDSRLVATEGCDESWPTLESLWPEG